MKRYIIKKQILRYSLVAALLGSASIVHEVYAQEIKPIINASLQGTVIDALTKEPLEGVTVQLHAVTHTVKTDRLGRFEFLTGQKLPFKIKVSFVGYVSKELIASISPTVIELEPSTEEIDEIVVVGYGTQRKKDLTGSLETIQQEQLVEKPVISLGQALQGEAVGVTIQQADGRPGSSPSVIIRGHGTFSSAGNQPLVLIDGIPGSLDAVNPQDVDNISILKDASSAAIYGARAANGVILVQTKKGIRDKTQIIYNATVGFSELADMPKFVDSWIYAQAYNEALTNAGQGAVYSEEDIQHFINGNNPDLYPNDKHYEMAFDNQAYQTFHNLSFAGGGEKLTYRLSGGYLRNDGLLQNNRSSSYKDNLENFYNKYNIRLNLDNQLTDKLKLTANFAGVVDDETGPGAQTGDRNTMRVVTRIARMPSAIPARTSEGYYGRVDKGAPWADLDANSFEYERNSNFTGNVNLDYQLFGPLTLQLRSGYVYNNQNYKLFAADEQVDATTYNGPAKLDVNWDLRRELTLEGLVSYQQSFGDHDISGLAGYSQIESKYEYLTGYRDEFPTNDLYELDAGSSANQKNTGGASAWALVSFFGRAKYSFKDRYLVEANLRYDGSSRFRDGKKFGLFPSFSAGWNIAEEQAVQDALPWVSGLKLRASWGRLGNQQIGNYPYQSFLSSGSNAVWGDNINPGVTLNTLPFRDIGWESTEISDIGLDVSVLNGQLNFVADYYNKTTSDILYSVTTAGVLGLDTSPVNAGKVRNSGWDFQLTYKGKVGDFGYSISPRYASIHSEVLQLANIERDIANGLFVGQPLHAIYGYVADGLFRDEEDIANYAKQAYDAVPGDIKYKDISGPDGVPDGKVDAAYDRRVIGQTTPKYNFGLSLSANWKGFDFNILLDGAGGMKKYLSNMAGRAFANKSNVQQWMWDNRWTPENPDPNAIYPRFYTHGGGNDEPYSYISTYWAKDASYLKVRSALVGYTFNQALSKKIGVGQARIFLSGRNLLTFDRFFEGWDPEIDVMVGEGVHYPMTRTYILGLNINF